MEKITLQQAIKTIDEWLNSDDVFVTNGEGGEVIKTAWVDCKKGSLLKRLCLLSSEYKDERSVATMLNQESEPLTQNNNSKIEEPQDWKERLREKNHMPWFEEWITKNVAQPLQSRNKELEQRIKELEQEIAGLLHDKYKSPTYDQLNAYVKELEAENSKLKK